MSTAVPSSPAGVVAAVLALLEHGRQDADDWLDVWLDVWLDEGALEREVLVRAIEHGVVVRAIR